MAEDTDDVPFAITKSGDVFTEFKVSEPHVVVFKQVMLTTILLSVVAGQAYFYQLMQGRGSPVTSHISVHVAGQNYTIPRRTVVIMFVLFFNHRCSDVYWRAMLFSLSLFANCSSLFCQLMGICSLTHVINWNWQNLKLTAYC